MEIWQKSETIDPDVRAYVESLVTALGGRSTYDDSYSIGDDATAVLKDILRWLRLHDFKNKLYDVRRCLAHANIVKGDLLEILAQFPEGGTESRLKSKRALACLRVLACLTDPLEGDMKEDEMTHNFHRHTPYLKLAQAGYKRAVLHFENAEILRTAVRISLPALAQPRAERSNNDTGIIEIVLNLVRNIAMITQPQDMPSQGDENEITRSTTINILAKQDIFSFLLTVGSGSGDEFQDLIIGQLQALFHLLKGIDPKKVFMERQQVERNNTKDFKDLLSKEKAMLDGYKKHAPTRHNRFGTMVWLKRDETNYSTVTGQHSITNDEQTLFHMDKSKKWDKPKVRGKNAPDANEQLAIGGKCEIDESASKALRSFVEDFLDSSFNPLFLALRKALERDAGSDRRNAEKVKQYFYLVSWFLNAATARHEAVAKENTKNAANTNSAIAQDNSYAYIAAVLDQETFVLLNRSMQYYLDEKNWQLVQCTMLAFTQILLTVQSMAESKDEEDQEIAENIQNRIFYEESTHERILQLLRGYNRQGFAYLDTVTDCTHVFVRMLERYSKVNVDLQIRSKRRTRRKQKPPPGGTEENTAAAEEDAEEAEQEEREIHQAASERKFDFAKLSAKFMNQHCVDTFLSLLNFYNDLTPEQLKRCHRYFYRLAFKNELAVLLFRADILLLFHRLIKGPEGLDPAIDGFKDWEQLVQQIFRRCVKWVSKDTEGEGWKEMCMIEMLFSKMGNSVFYMQNGYDRVVEKATPRPPAELEFKASITEDQKIGVVVGAMLEHSKADGVSWVREEVKRASEEREAWEQGEEARRQQQQGDVDAVDLDLTASAPTIFLQPGESAERRLALFKDKHLRLLLTSLGYQRLGVAEDLEASWILPSDLSSSQLKDLHTKIQQAEFDPPTFDGQSATDMTRAKGSYVRRETAGPFDDASDADEGASDADEPMFPPNMREKRKQAEGDDGTPKKKRRLQRRNAEDPTDSDAERRADSRNEKERERNAKIKSSLFITASDDESDAEGDAEFFRLEEQRRQKMKGIIRNQLLQEMNETTAAGNGKKASKKEVKAKAKEVARALGEDEDDLIDGVVSDMDADVADVSSPMEVDAPAREKDVPVPDEPIVDVDDDDEDEDDAPVSKRPPARRMRAGFVLDDSDSDE